MSIMDDACRQAWEATEFVAIATQGENGPHVVGNWGDYARKLGLRGDTVLLPAGHYHQTEENLKKDNRVTLLIASRKVKGSHGPGQGYELTGTAQILSSGPEAEEVKKGFPWARGALVIRVDKATAQL